MTFHFHLRPKSALICVNQWLKGFAVGLLWPGRRSAVADNLSPVEEAARCNNRRASTVILNRGVF